MKLGDILNNLAWSSDNLDKNKSSLTHKITAGVQTYLDERGFKPIETEVPVANEWVADVASVTVPTETELQKMKLVGPCPHHQWSGPNGWKQTLPIFQQKYAAWKQTVDALPNMITAVVEIKTTKADFQRDDKWTRSSPANLRYIAIPSGMLTRSEFPVGWWVLEFGVKGKLLRVAQKGNLDIVRVEDQLNVVHAIAIRRDHRTRYEWLRGIRKQFNARQTEQKQHYRVEKIASAMLDVINGGGPLLKHNTPEACFDFHRIKFSSLSQHTREEIRKLWGIVKRN